MSISGAIVAAFLATVAGLGVIAGWRVARLDEATAIAAAAARHAERTGQPESFCVGRPGDSWRQWVLVSCGAQTYAIDRLGRIAALTPPGPGA